MNSLLICPHCNGAISNVTQMCPGCGAATGRGRPLAGGGRQYVAAPQSVLMIVLDALRAPIGRRRPGPPTIVEIVSDSK